MSDASAQVHTVVMNEATSMVDASTPQVVLVHGALDRHQAFRRVARRLPQHRVVIYDRRGYGESVGLAPAGDLDRHTADLMAVIGDTPTVVVGHSYGGLVALGAVAEFPGRFPAVGAFEPPTPWKSWWPRDGTDPEAGTAPEVIVEWFYRRMVGDDAWERLSDGLRAELSAEGPALTTDLLVGRNGPEFDAAAITVPVMIGYGEHSLPRHIRAATELAAELPDAEIMAIDGASHGAHRSHPGAFAAFVEATVQRSSQRAPSE